MKYLILGDTAGVGSLVARELRKEHKVKLLTRTAHKLRFTNYYGEKSVSGRYKKFVLYLYKELLFFRPDVVLINFWLDGINKVKKASKILGFNPKIIFYAHGSDIRSKKDTFNLENYSVVKFLVSVKDINYPKTYLAPVPVDLEHFKPQRKNNNNNALWIMTNDSADNHINQIKTFGIKNKLKLTILDRRKNPVLYRDMPDYLSKFKFLIDWKFIDEIPEFTGSNRNTLSKTGYEALACGLSVYTNDGQCISPGEIDLTQRMNYIIELIK